MSPRDRVRRRPGIRLAKRCEAQANVAEAASDGHRRSRHRARPPPRGHRCARPRDPRASQRQRARHAQAIGALKSGGAAYRPEREAQVLSRLAIRQSRTAAERSGHRHLPRGDVGVPRARADAARRVSRSAGNVFATRRSESISAQFVDMRTVRDDRRGVPRGRERDRPTTRSFRSRIRPKARSGARSISCSRRRFSICGEMKLRIRQNLLVDARRASAEVTCVYSHAQSLAQCVQWLARHLPGVPRVAGGEQRRGRAARGSRAGRRRDRRRERRGASTGSTILAPHIEDEPNNTTRFWVLGKPARPAVRTRRNLARDVGAQPAGRRAQPARAVREARRSMTRFESRPARTGLWEYLFFVDLAGHETDAAVAAALDGACQKTPRSSRSWAPILQRFIRSAMSGTPDPELRRDPSRHAPVYVARVRPYVPGKPIDELAREFGLDRDGHRQARVQRESARAERRGARRRSPPRRPSSARYPDGNGFALKAGARRHATASRPTASCSATAATTFSSS